MSLRARTGVTGLALLLIAGGCLLLAYGPALAPQPPFSEINVGAREILGRELSDGVELRVAAAGDYDISVRFRCLSALPCQVRAELRGADGQPVVAAEVVEQRSLVFTERLLFHGSVPLQPLRRYDLALSDASVGVAIDRIQLRNRKTKWMASFEAEDGHLSPATLVLLDPDASGGAAVGTLVSGDGLETTTQSFRAQADGLDGLFLGAIVGVAAKDEVRLRLRRASDGEVLAEQRTNAAEVGRGAPYFQLRFPPVPQSRGQRFELQIEQPADHPLPLVVAEAGRYPDGDLRFGRFRSTNCLLFAPRYASPWSMLALVALGLAPFAIAAGFAGPTAGRLALSILLPLVMLISVANWQREYQFKSGYEWMPDGYDVFAQHVADFVHTPNATTFASLQSFLSHYPHTHTPVVPTLVGGLASLGLQIPRAYLIVSFLFTVMGGWALLALLERLGRESWPAVWLVTCLGLTHFLFLKAAVKTSTDPAGYATIVFALLFAVLLCQQQQPTWPLRTAVVMAVTLALFTRATALPLSLAIGLGFIGRRILDERPLRKALPTGAALALVPLALFFGGILLTGFWPTFALIQTKVAGFATSRTARRYIGCLVVLAQFLWLPPLARLRLRLRSGVPDILRKEAVLGPVWFLGLLAFIAVSPTPFWSRHFLHALPGLLIFVVPAAAALHRSRPRLTLAWFWLHVGVNLAFMALSIWKGTPIGPNYILS
jgi:hypothetical protein